MRHLIALAALVPVLAVASPAVVKPPSRVDAVTVYRSGARVERIARVELPAGPARVVLQGLPDGLEDDSIRVRGEGTARARLFGVTVERVTGEGAVAADARAAEEQLERLADEDRALEDRIAAAKARARFVESLRSSYSEERAKNLAVRGVSTKEWADLVSFVDAELTRAAGEQRAAERARRELARKVTQARAELDKVQAKRAVTTKAVTVEVEAERAGAVELVVSYAVSSAGWRPVWDARLTPESSTVALSLLGAVWQSSGEDWNDVRLAVSTARPAGGLYVPRLEPVYLTRLEPRPPASAAPMMSRRAAGAPARAKAEAAAALEEAPAPAAQPLEEPEAEVQEGLLAATFSAPRRETVDGAGQARKVSLARFPLQATLVRTAAPRVEAAAFLTAKAVNETGFPLLPGEVGVYVGDDFVGRAALPATPPGGELELAFGQDPRVEVERRVLERKHETAGLLTKDDVIRYRVRVKLRSRYAAPVAVKLLDLVPVSREEKIQVNVLDGTTAPTREDPDRPGVRIHELTLAPREERAIELRYEVRTPRGYPVSGLE
jgi:uncharacterized protein (TIGR02231 family)